MEYEARITQETEEPNLFVLTITGSKENVSHPTLSRVVNFRRTDSIEEIRKYQTVEDLRHDISRERSWRIRERVASGVILVVGGAMGGTLGALERIPYPLMLATIAVPFGALGMIVWEHANAGLAKFNSALKTFKETQFRVGEPPVEISQAFEQNEQIPAEA